MSVLRPRVRALAFVALACIASGFAIAAGCSGTVDPQGGLMLVLRNDGTLGQADYLELQITPTSGGAPYKSQGYRIPDEVTLPTTLAIASNGSPTASVVINASLWASGVLLDDRVNEVIEIPTERVAELDIVFSASCTEYAQEEGDGGAESKCPTGQTCEPGQSCVSNVVNGGQLPTFVGDAGLPSASSSGGSGSSSGGSGSSGSSSGGVSAPDASIVYAPTGCAYSYSPSPQLPFTGFAFDDATQPDSGAGAAPIRVRLGVAGGTTKGSPGYADPTTTAAFRWETAAPTTNARVRYGTSPGTLSSVQTGYVFTNPANSFSSSPSYFHEVDVCGLSPATTYYYQVGGGASGEELWSATQSFTTVSASGTIVVGVYGDARDSVATWQLVNQRMVGQVDLLLETGDVVDEGASESNFADWLGAIWNGDGGPGAFTLGQIAIVPVEGNHEQEAADYFANFSLPGSGLYAGTYASFEVGNTHFALIDDQLIGAGTSAESTAQLAWLDLDLAAANADRTNHPFLVVVNHRGLYSTSEHAADSDVLQARASLAPLYDKYHVTLALNGHDHEYERSYPLNAGSPASGPPAIVDGGTTYVISAGAGADPYVTSTNPASYSALRWAYSSTGPIGCYQVLTLSGTQLVMKSYGLSASGTSVADDEVIDSVTFTP